VEIDETTLNKIATIADGNYYRATSNTKLKEVYEKIDKLERTKLQVKEYSRKEEEYAIFAIIALAALMLELLLRNTLLKTIP
jgi:Ca-activated chloride channel family protein